MVTLRNSILFLYTEKSRRQNKGFERILTKLKSDNNFHLEECENFEEATKLLEAEDREFNVVLVHVHSSDPRDLWRRVYYKTRAYNKYTEVIVIVVDNDEDNRIEAREVLSSGCFAFFQYTFASEVLFGYIEAARLKCEERRIRVDFSRELNEGVTTVEEVAKKVADQLEKLTGYDNITISLLKKRRSEQGYLRKLIYTNLDRSGGTNGIKWHLLKPTNEDALVKRILSNDTIGLKRRVFPNPRADEEIKDLFDAEHETPKVNSWIILPLRHAGEIIGLITLDAFEKDRFSYDKINEVVLEQIANQAAAAIRYAEKDEVNQRLGEALKALNSSTSLDEILEKLAEQACRLVGGLFSYIVVPDQAQTRLEFRGAWSRNHKKRYIKVLEDRVVFPDPVDETIKKPGFLLPPYNQNVEKKGITTLAFTTLEKQLLENIRDENYHEISEEARNSYYPYPYVYRDDSGKHHTIMPSSDIALPILLELDQNPSSASPGRNVALGVINVEHEEPFAFTEEHIFALEQLAEFAAIAIQNRKKQAFINELYDLSDFPYDENLSFNSIELFLDQVAEKVKKVSKAKYVTVHSVKDNKSFFIGKSNPPQYIKEGSRWGNSETEGHTFWSVRNKKPVIINNTRKYAEAPGNYKDIFGESYTRINKLPIPINERTDLKIFQALACIPMILPNQEAIGVIWMHHEKSPDYTLEEIDLLLKFASRAANTLNVVEKITFQKIEAEIGTTRDKATVLKKIVDMAKYYFGLRGAAIYEANHEFRTLTRVKSNITHFHSVETLFYKPENTQGLSGHLMRGIDIGGYPYADGYCYIPRYDLKHYPHAIQYYDTKQIQELGSVVGIRMPLNSTPSNAVGVLIIADEVGREYNKSKQDLLRFADIAGKCLQVIEREKKLRDNTDLQSQTPEEQLYKVQQKYNRLYDRSVMGVGFFIATLMLIFLLSQPKEIHILGIVIGSLAKVFLAVSVFFLTLLLSPRLRKNAIVGASLSIIGGVITNLVTEWLF
jgi:GAF domain-containing protein